MTRPGPVEKIFTLKTCFVLIKMIVNETFFCFSEKILCIMKFVCDSSVKYYFSSSSVVDNHQKI